MVFAGDDSGGSGELPLELPPINVPGGGGIATEFNQSTAPDARIVHMLVQGGGQILDIPVSLDPVSAQYLTSHNNLPKLDIEKLAQGDVVREPVEGGVYFDFNDVKRVLLNDYNVAVQNGAKALNELRRANGESITEKWEKVEFDDLSQSELDSISTRLTDTIDHLRFPASARQENENIDAYVMQGEQALQKILDVGALAVNMKGLADTYEPLDLEDSNLIDLSPYRMDAASGGSLGLTPKQ